MFHHRGDAGVRESTHERRRVARDHRHDATERSQSVGIGLAGIDRATVDVGDGREVRVETRRDELSANPQTRGGDLRGTFRAPHRLCPGEVADEIGEAHHTAALLIGHHHGRVVPRPLALQRGEHGGQTRPGRGAEEDHPAVPGFRGRSHRADLRGIDRYRDRLVRDLAQGPGGDDLGRARQVRRLRRAGTPRARRHHHRRGEWCQHRQASQHPHDPRLRAQMANNTPLR